MDKETYLQYLTEEKLTSMVINITGKLNIAKIRCRRIKDPDAKSKCWKAYRLKHAALTVTVVKDRLAKCKDEECKKLQQKYLKIAEERLAKAKGKYNE